MHYLKPRQAVVMLLLFFTVFVSGQLMRGGWYGIGQRLGWESASVIRAELASMSFEIVAALILLLYSAWLLWRSRGCETHGGKEKATLAVERVGLVLFTFFAVIDLFMLAWLFCLIASARSELWG